MRKNDLMDCFSIKNARFYRNRIVIARRKGEVIIDLNAIERIDYVKPTLLNYVYATVLFGGVCPGRLLIYLKDGPLVKRAYGTRLYSIKIRYKDYLKLPEVYNERFVLKYYN